MRPTRALREALQLRRHFHWRDIPFQHEVKPHEMNADRLVGMPAPRVLNGVRIHRQLVRLSEENGILELDGQDFLEHRPAFRRCVKLTGVALFAQRHLEPASGACSRCVFSQA